ncbi:MAG: tetratricopeptide repeat protein [Ktedonobacteraceae bacterium]
MGRRLGIIVGINTYQDTAFRPLQYAENDARALAQWLVNTKGGNWAPADVQHVQGAYATRELIESLIHQACAKVAGPGDLVFVYFAGHAFLNENNGEGYLTFTNTQYQQPTTAIHLPSLVQQAMGGSRAAHVIFMLDCFQTGPGWQMQRSSPFDAKPLLGPNIVNALEQTSDRFILCSCRGNEQAPESGEKGLGRFVYRMILGLCGPASEPKTNKITLQSLYAYLLKSLGEQQRPQLFGQERLPLILVGEMPTLTTPQTSGQRQNEQAAGQSRNVSTSFVPGMPSSSAYPQVSTGSLKEQALPSGAATAQLSPTTTGEVTLSPAEQQCAMLVKQARHLIQMQNPNEAFNLVEQALRIVPNDIPALILKGQLLGTVGRFEEALYVVGLVLQLDPNNALTWSMRAALLTNTGQYQLALEAIERSLELDPNNPETYSIKTNIMGQIAAQQSQKLMAIRRDRPASFWSAAGIQFLGLIIGLAGGVLPLIQPKMPIMLALALQSLGLAMLCVNAVRGSYLYGFTRFLLTFFFSVLAAILLGSAILLGGVLRFSTGRVYTMLQSKPDLLLPLSFLGIWLALAVVLPLLLALFSLIAGLIMGVRRKKG